MSKALVVLSGGQDSTTCLYLAKRRYDEIHAVTFDYGQRHKIELEAAKKIAHMAGVASHEFIKIGDHILESTSPLVTSNRLEQYVDADSLPGGIEKTFVPMRNQLFLTIAANRAVARGCNDIYTGVSQADYGGYPDCRNKFILALEEATNLGTFDDATGGGIIVQTPLMNMSKAQTVQMALKLPGCYSALAHSHTAYDGQYPPRGKDHASILRAKGFEEAGVPDPLVLRAVYGDEVMHPDEIPDTDNYSEEVVKFYWMTLVDDMEHNDALPIN
ncbi:MAG: 7-cyano-7-deazaguanine synthase QueC [Acholeplasmataceae bacterium]|nr:7-cyano-7-deazaguanine synthase QueC [Acholeplasmataceae bacterium]